VEKQSLALSVAGLFAALVLAACGGGHSTHANPAGTSSITTPGCDANGKPPPGAIVCSGATGDSGGSLTLPAPTQRTRSAMQFRPVHSVHPGTCSTPPSDPTPDAAATLPGHGGLCYDLAPAQLTVAHAAVSAHRGPGGDVVVDFVLDPPDAAAFDRVATDNYQHQVALVMFGQVQSAPTINALQFNGRGQISGMSLEQAANVRAALAG
jgi:hypothetical protein